MANRKINFPKSGGIYCFENTFNGKKYIGKTMNLKRRITAHLSRLSKNKDESHLLQNAWNKYGEKKFNIYIVEQNEDEALLFEKEVFYIKEWNTKSPNGYNLTDGGEGISGYKIPKEKLESRSGKNHHWFGVRLFGKKNPAFGRKHTDKEKELMKKNHADFSGENHPQYGKSLSEEHKEKIRKSRTGTTLSDETREKISKSGIERKMYGENHPCFGSKRKGATSKYHGVNLVKYLKYKRWHSWVTVNKKVKSLGYFETEQEAAIAHDLFIKENNLPNPLNFPENYN